MNASTTPPNLFDAILEQTTAALKKIIPDADAATVAQTAVTNIGGYDKISGVAVTDMPLIDVRRIADGAAQRVASVVATAAKSNQTADPTAMANAATQGLGATFLKCAKVEGTDLTDGLNQVAHRTGMNMNTTAYVTDLTKTANDAQSRNPNNWVRYGSAALGGILGFTLLKRAFSSKKVMNQETGEVETKSRPWYDRLLSFLGGAGVIILGYKMGAQNKSFRESVSEMASPIGKAKSWVERVSAPSFSIGRAP